MDRTSPRRRSVLVTMLAMLAMYQADVAIVNVATPSIRADLGANGAELELIVGGYLLASAAVLILGARLGHLHGPRRVFLIGVALFGVASLACGLAPDPTTLIVARVVQGIGGAVAFPQVLVVIQRTFAEGAERSRALAGYAFALAGGAVLGQILGGVLVAADIAGSGWRPIFLVNVPVAVAVVGAGVAVLPHDRPDDRSVRLDLPGAALMSAALLALVVPLTLGRESGWPVWTWLSLVASIPLLAAFVAVERRRTAHGRSPLIDLGVIRRPAIAWALTAQGLATATYFALLFALAQYLQRGLGVGALFSGLALVPWVLAFGIPGHLFPLLPDAVRRMLPAIGPAILAIAYAGLAVTASIGSVPAVPLLVLLGLGGFGLGTGFSAVIQHVTREATGRVAADISGVLTTSGQVAGAIGVAALGTLYLALVSEPGAAVASHSFAVLMIVSAVVAVASALSGLLAVRAPRRAV